MQTRKFSTPRSANPRLSELAQLAQWGLLTEGQIQRNRRRFRDEVERCRQDPDRVHLFNALEEGEALDFLGLLTDDERRLVRTARRAFDADTKRWEIEEAIG